jgi:hypothetical protein
MIKLDPTGHGQTVVAGLPITGTRDERRAALREALKGGLMPPPGPTTPEAPEAPSERDELEQALTELGEELKSEFDQVLPPAKVAELRAEPEKARRFVKSWRVDHALHRRDEVRAGARAALASAEAGERELSEFGVLGRSAAAAARKARLK